MPIHDWTRVDAGLFHAFQQSWIVALCNALNAGGVPSDYFALLEPWIKVPIPDVLTLRSSSGDEGPSAHAAGLAVAVAPPRAQLVRRLEEELYARKADRVTVRHRHGEVVAVIEIVSPGNKASTRELSAFVQKTWELIAQGVHLLVIDLFPPTKRDPLGIHRVIWDELDDEFALPADKRLLVAAYDAGPPGVVYVDPVAVGDPLPKMPLFLKPEFYVPAPLETTYEATWNSFPAALKGLLDPPAVSSP